LSVVVNISYAYKKRKSVDEVPVWSNC